MKKVCVWMLLVILLLPLESCQSEGVVEMEQIPLEAHFEANRVNLSFREIDDLACRYNTQTILSRLKVAQYKSLGNNAFGASSCYTVVQGSDALCILWFDMDYCYTVRQIRYSKQYIEPEISAIKCGTPWLDVKEMDPEGDYDYMYASWSEAAKLSFHYFESGNGYIITYDSEREVEEIIHFIL